MSGFPFAPPVPQPPPAVSNFSNFCHDLRKSLPLVGQSRAPNLPQLLPLFIRVLVWNIFGANKANAAMYRNALVPSVAGVIDADVMLLQETKTRKLIDFIMSSCGNYRNWCLIPAGKWMESCILYDANKFDRIDPDKHWSLNNILDSALEKVYPRTSIINIECQRLIRERTNYAALLPKPWTIASQTPPYWRNTPTIFLSFHNVYRSKGTPVRVAAAKGFCEMVQIISDKTRCGAIAGADMNEVMEHPLFLPYDPTPRRARRVIDYIILAAPNRRRVVINSCDFIGAEQDPFNPLHGVMKNLLRPLYNGPSPTIDDYGQAVPHDPLVADFTLVHPSRCYT